MADDHHTAREIQQRVFQCAEGIDIQIVGRFVEQQHVSPGFQHLRQMHSVTFAPRQLANLFLLIRPPEIKGSTICPALHLLVAEMDDILAVGDFLPNGLVVGQRITALVDISQFDGIAETQRSKSGFSSPVTGGKRRLTGTVGADDADNG